MVKLGSLFDGSGGFPLAGSLCGIEPVWAAEVEPYPIAVTRSRFPNMKHLGSVTDIKGGDIEPVDIITFGSPCQDLSVAGKRAGLKHESNGDEETTRSGLFMEAVRIIKEMRKATNGEYPTFAVWENVPGAFSSNKGEDFRTVLEELIKIVEPTAVMPAVPKNGWPYADSYCGDGWSLAYRVFDAQYWGVPQRRRRIYLVLDLRGQRAGKVSFEREGVRGNFATFKTAGQGTAGDAANRTGADDCEGEGNCLTPWDYQGKRVYSADGVFPTLYSAENSGQQQQAVCIVEPVPYTLKIRSGCEGSGKGALIQEDKTATLATNNDQYLFQPIAFAQNQRDEVRDLKDKAGALAAEPGMKQQTFIAVPNILLEAAGFKAGQSMAGGIGWQKECAATLAAQCSGTEPTVCVKCYDARGNGDGQTVSTLTGDHENRITDYTSVLCMATQQGGAEIMENLCPTITASAGMSGNNQPVVCEPIPIHDKATRYKGGGPTRNGDGAGNGLGVGKSGDPCPTLSTCDHHMVCYCEPAVAFTMQAFGNYKDCGIGSGLKARDYKDATDLVVESAGIDCRNFTEYPELYPTLQAKPNGGQSLNFSGAVRVQYIVRRLTPTERARLQGFPDDWGHPDHKEDFTDEEYRFWLNVRNTHASINGKPQKDYTKAQMLTWYNKLHTDSSEYKMWGNGISLPTALYVVQGIVEALKGGDDE